MTTVKKILGVIGLIALGIFSSLCVLVCIFVIYLILGPLQGPVSTLEGTALWIYVIFFGRFVVVGNVLGGFLGTLIALLIGRALDTKNDRWKVLASVVGGALGGLIALVLLVLAFYLAGP